MYGLDSSCKFWKHFLFFFIQIVDVHVIEIMDFVKFMKRLHKDSLFFQVFTMYNVLIIS